MNFVAHLFLAVPNDSFRVGSILADFTMGTLDMLEAKFGHKIVCGIKHHRQVDAFTDSHAEVIRCVDAINGDFGLYGGIVTDIMFDHFLLTQWDRYAQVSKSVFFESIYHSLGLIRPNFPERYKQTVRRMLEMRWLGTYEELDNVAYAMRRVGERFSRKTPLADALPGITKHYAVLERGFFRFFPDLQQHAALAADKIWNPTLLG